MPSSNSRPSGQGPTVNPAMISDLKPFDEFDDTAGWADGLPFDDEPMFQQGWEFPGTETPPTPYDQGLYSTPLSWDPPQQRVEPPEAIRPSYPTPMSTLSLAQQEKLRSIAMPDHLQYDRSPQSVSSTYKSGSVSSPDQQDNGRKRKSSAEVEEDDEDDNGSHPPVKKTAHNMIEKRYRTNLNDKIAALRDSVPSLRVMSKSARGEDASLDKEDLQGLTPAHKLNKATVLSKATEYIRHLEKRNTRLADDNAAMKARIAAFEKLFMSGAMGVNPVPQNMPTRYAQEPYMPTPVNGQITPGVSPQGMIEVPEDIRRMNAQSQQSQQLMNVPQDQYQPTYRLQNGSNAWPGRSGYFGKMMVGSLAGLMILEGFAESEQQGNEPAARGLSALPIQVLRSFAQSLKSSHGLSALGYHASSSQLFGGLKLLLVFGVILYVFVPSYFISDPKRPRKAENASLAAAPSLASSIRVRRQAWETAVQTVWVPRHNFFLEAAALCIKMVKLSLRNAIGWYGYATLTGITEQQEAARIKAWSIALDAQLAGGDIEISKSRLTLTLLASGTLPHTPARLMLKALHIRVLLWQLGNLGSNGNSLVHAWASKLAQRKWNEAKQLQQLLTHTHGTQKNDSEPLPEHLAVLLEQECDEVLVDTIGQRAHNLAWNLPTTHNAIGSSDGMNQVVADFAIRSPLDALAAWWSSLVLQRAMSRSLLSGTDEQISHDIDLAIKTAPIGSSSQIRALVARAILLDEKRGANIAAAFQVLGPLKPQTTTRPEPSSDADDVPKRAQKAEATESPLINETMSLKSMPDLRMSLQCAMAIAHLKRSDNPTAAYEIINTIRPTHLSLLGFASAFKLMQAIFMHEKAVAQCSRALELLSGNLRIWIGGPDGAKSGVPKETREMAVLQCLTITKLMVGIEKDPGYESMSEEDLAADDGEGC
ncbi:MAG: hypothetical protein M1818_006684 [Claussenomyces sp. TS43310]|nr:MAG: hypothetical protein M1818_006884 [Claussenomyces sp. TS43310]KAI9735106.1 MAG: hypothetical protein M1818_006684 [Claussenomyces sp. TS43310]